MPSLTLFLSHVPMTNSTIHRFTKRSKVMRHFRFKDMLFTVVLHIFQNQWSKLCLRVEWIWSW